ncbi:RNA polymerase sigma factor [Polaromonas sp.]|uniref:RNA polymerase sigma factor n=1 Tax=Polaromonas sp. TaxID=1869339 RepID=UPI00326589BE
MDGPDSDTTDAELLQALRAGNAWAYERLIRRYNRLLFRAARGIVNNTEEAQDVVQETYLRAFVSIENFRGEASLGTWLARIAINQALVHQRHLGRRVLWNDQPGAQEGDMVSELEGPDSPDPQDEALRAELRQHLVEAVDALAPIYRTVFILRGVEGLSVEDTAVTLGVSTDVVKTRYLRARALLRGALSPSDPAAATEFYGFAGSQCDQTVAWVLAQLRNRGVIRDH